MSLFEYSAKFILIEELETVDSGSSPWTVYGIRQDDCWVQESMARTVTLVKNSDESVHWSWITEEKYWKCFLGLFSKGLTVPA